ncbi:MAG: cation:dicarboxylase symporter family transporter [Clostridia bacterium]|nr:cation:dicarboxylase symporter family transporter [Clostridia bacterium]
MAFGDRNGWKSEEYPLTGEAIEEIAARLDGFLRAIRTERTDVLRIRFSLEEALLRWRDHFGEDARVRIGTGMRLGRPMITLELPGDNYDPLTSAENDLGAWADTLLNGIGLNPVYTYRRNTNLVQLRLKRSQLHPAFALGIAVLAGLLVGFLGDALLPETIQSRALSAVFEPVRNAFLRILNTAGAPVVFFSVLAAVCGVGNAAAMSRDGRRLILRFFVSISVVTAAATALSALVFHPLYAGDAVRAGVHGILDFFVRIIPTDILSPMIAGDSPQLILIALVLGHAVLTAGQHSGGLVSLIDQLNTTGLLVADWVGRVTPFFVAVLLILGIWNNSLAPLLDIWKPLLLFCLLSGGLIALQLLLTSWKEGISPRRLFLKMRDSFAAALRTCSVNSAYGANELCCERRLGIGRQLTRTGLPLGLLIYMPAGTVASMIVIFYEAGVAEVAVFPFWILMAMLLTIALQAASPPVTGIGILTYTVIFTQLGIPEDALVTAMLLDVLFGLATAPINQAMLQLELLLEADRTGVLDKELLKR